MFYSKKEREPWVIVDCFLKSCNNKMLKLVAKNMENKTESFDKIVLSSIWQNDNETISGIIHVILPWNLKKRA